MAVATLISATPFNPINGDQRLAVPTLVWDEDPHHVSEEKKMKEKLSYALKIISGPLHNCSGNLSNDGRRCRFNFTLNLEPTSTNIAQLRKEKKKKKEVVGPSGRKN